MRNYTERDRNRILRAMESDILALVAVDTVTDDFQVLYSDGAYRDFGEGHRGKRFFDMWKTVGASLMAEADRERMVSEISRDALLFELSRSDAYATICRFMRGGSEAFCRVRVKKDVIEPDTLVISIRNVDGEIRRARERLLARKKRESDMERMEESLNNMRMKSFIDQMHPHFLYNSLSSIREIVLQDPEYGAELIYDFTTHLRAGIRAATGADLIPFAQEMENIRAYVNIEEMRFAGRLKVEYDIAAEDFEVPPLSIQPLVENAIRHGIYESEKEIGTVLVKTERRDGSVLISVTDDGCGFDPEKTGEEIAAGEKDSTGLYNAMFRLENLLGASISIKSAPGEGAQVTVTIPEKR